MLLAGALDYHEEDGAAAGSAEQRPSAYAHAKGLTREDVTARLKSDDVIDALIDAVCHGLTDLQTQVAATGADLNVKFHLEGGQYEMAFGSLDQFYGGLEGLIGPPQMIHGSITMAMEADHCQHQDSTVAFQSSNGASTTAAQEWEIVYDPQPGKSYPERNAFRTRAGEELFPERCRHTMLPSLLRERMEEQNLRLDAAGHVPMVLDEAIAGRLYTGPMYEKYNAVLRASSHNAHLVQKKKQLCGDNNYATTIRASTRLGPPTSIHPPRSSDLWVVPPLLTSLHVASWAHPEVAGSVLRCADAINSCVIKLSKLTQAVKVWRGFKGATLPRQFFEPNESGVRGGIEYGFSSTTTERAQAVHYADGRQSTIFEMQARDLPRSPHPPKRPSLDLR